MAPPRVTEILRSSIRLQNEIFSFNEELDHSRSRSSEWFSEGSASLHREARSELNQGFLDITMGFGQLQNGRADLGARRELSAFFHLHRSQQLLARYREQTQQQTQVHRQTATVMGATVGAGALGAGAGFLFAGPVGMGVLALSSAAHGFL
ncbi:MAG: hypothetical protein JNK65_06100, partial [Deltaproteobacteria bacterium]|nr:hypothetical protein [Deltaproteobacteria bacterium]